MAIKKVLEIGIINTLRFNLRYFPGGIHLYALVARRVKLQKLEGRIDIKNPSFGCIKLGFPRVGVFDSRFERSIWDNSGLVEIEDKANINSGFRISNAGVIKLGSDFKLSANSTIICKKAISFGINVLMSWDVLIMDTDLHRIIFQDEQINEPEEIQIGNNVWIGCRSLILKGSKICDNCIIAAGTTVSGAINEKANPPAMLGRIE